MKDAKKIALDLNKQAPDYIPPYTFLAVIAAAERKYDDSAALIQKVLARDPANLDALMANARMLLAKGQVTNAITQLEQIISLYGKVPAAELELGRASLLTGDLVKSMACLNLAVAGDPNLTDAVLLLADINVRKGDTAAAVAALTQLIARRPSLMEAHFLLAGAYSAQKNFNDAAAVLQRMISLFPPNPRVHYLLGMLLLEQGQAAEARHAVETAREISQDNIPALCILLSIIFKRNLSSRMPCFFARKYNWLRKIMTVPNSRYSRRLN